MAEEVGMISNDASPLPDTEVHYLRSEHVGDEFKILVGHCGSSGSAPPQVLFIGDPWANFGTAVEMVRMLNDSGDLPPVLVVAVGYRVAKIADNYPLRSRDFSR
jgi:predicted alpha/beta superfamily hydrolase